MYKELIIQRLAGLGYTVTEADDWLIDYVTEKVVHSIQADCNITDIPTGLTGIIVDRVCGEFLYAKRNMGQLEIESINLEMAVKSIKEGDTDITYATDSNITPEQRLDGVINALKGCGGSLASYRCIRW